MIIINYIVEENIFAVIAYTLLLRKKYYSVILKIALKLMVSKRLRRLKKMNMLNSRLFFTKMKSPFMIYAYFERALVPTDNGKQNPNES